MKPILKVPVQTLDNEFEKIKNDFLYETHKRYTIIGRALRVAAVYNAFYIDIRKENYNKLLDISGILLDSLVA